MRQLGSGTVKKLVVLAAAGTMLGLLTTSTTIGALINGTLPSSSFTYASTQDNSVNVASSGLTQDDIDALQRYVDKLAAIANPTQTQQAALTKYRARLAEYTARYASSVDLRVSKSANVKTTYSRVPPAQSYESGWHYHNGPVIVTVTVGVLTFYDTKCGTWDLPAGHTYVESPRQVLDAKALPAKNAGIENVEWFTTRVFPEGAIDPVPVPAPCAP